ncbi:hypothetical protein B0H11DRAFT_2150378 [Mycena galericulata]|nr:hypothetical protein B0H11DRAFT_2150378 [Mycena galericulata]
MASPTFRLARFPLNTLLPLVVPIPPRLPTTASLATSLSFDIFFTPLRVHDNDSYTLGNEKRKLDETEDDRPHKITKVETGAHE